MEGSITKYPKVQPMGERSILVEFEPEISEKCLEKVIFYKILLENKYPKEKVEVINTYSSLLIFYIDDIENLYDEVLDVKALVGRANITKKINWQLFHVPVCYDVVFGLDLEEISKVKMLSFQEIIALHTAPIYTVHFIGFLPGFLYLGGLDKNLHISRRKSPRLTVPKGAVGIGEKQTGIYPKSSPGGWQIIGNSPLNFFEKNLDPPCEILAGDKVKFYSISRDEYEQILEEVRSGKFEIKGVKYEG